MRSMERRSSSTSRRQMPDGHLDRCASVAGSTPHLPVRVPGGVVHVGTADFATDRAVSALHATAWTLGAVLS